MSFRYFPLVLAALGLAVLATVACGGGEPASLEERALSRALSIDKSLICPVCPGETIDQSQVELASQMRGVVREKLAEGWTREQVLQFFVDRYGEGVLAAPPKSGFNLIAWIVPLVVVAASAVLLALVLRAMRRGYGARPDEGPPGEEGLEPYLSAVDQEVGIGRQGASGQGDSRNEGHG